MEVGKRGVKFGRMCQMESSALTSQAYEVGSLDEPELRQRAQMALPVVLDLLTRGVPSELPAQGR